MAHPRNYDKYKYLIGTELNGWKILDIKVYDEKRNTYALAQCHCGNVVEVPLTKISTGYMADCGCERINNLKQHSYDKYEHLIGTTINDWTVLDIVAPQDGDGHTRAICECKCGRTKNIRMTYLISGRSKNCGCGRKETLRETRTKNLVGQRFGKLVMVELLEESNKFNRRVYRCKCDCGNEVFIPSGSLLSRHTHSCGCLSSYYNMYIHRYFEECGINHQTEFSVRIDGRCYRFDFYLPDYNLFVEYDGAQHFQPVAFDGNHDTAEVNFQKCQEYDNVKNKYCADNNINLLRIPYWESDNIETIISNHLQRLSEKGSVA